MVGYAIAIRFINLTIGIIVLALGIITFNKLKGGVLSWSALFLAISGLLYTLHAGIEVLGFGEELYAVTALLATLALGFTLIICDITIRFLGVKS